MDVVFPQGKNAAAVVAELIGFSSSLSKHVFQAAAAKHPERHLNAQIGLPAADALGIEKTFEVGRSRVRRIQLGESRRNQQDIGRQRR